MYNKPLLIEHNYKYYTSKNTVHITSNDYVSNKCTKIVQSTSIVILLFPFLVFLIS